MVKYAKVFLMACSILCCISGCIILDTGKTPVRGYTDDIYSTYSKTAKIRDLGNLKKEGFITEEEFAQEKKKILDGECK